MIPVTNSHESIIHKTYVYEHLVVAPIVYMKSNITKLLLSRSIHQARISCFCLAKSPHETASSVSMILGVKREGLCGILDQKGATPKDQRPCHKATRRPRLHSQRRPMLLMTQVTGTEDVHPPIPRPRLWEKQLNPAL